MKLIGGYIVIRNENGQRIWSRPITFGDAWKVRFEPDPNPPKPCQGERK